MILPLYQTEKDRRRTELQSSRHPTPAPLVTCVHQPGLKKPKILRPSKVISPDRNQGLKHMDLWGTFQFPAVARALCLRRNSHLRKSSNLKSIWKKFKQEQRFFFMTADSKGVQNQGMFLQVFCSLDIMLH